MNLTERQQRALEHARGLLAELPDTRPGAVVPEEWYAAVRAELADVAAAFDDDGGAS